MGEIIFDSMIDVKGLECPRPLLKMKQTLENMQSGQVLKVIASDPQTKLTFPPYLLRSGDTILAVEDHGAEIRYYINKK